MNILFIGDSLTRGYDVPYGEGWVELSIKALRAVEKETSFKGASPWILRNAGVDGATLQAIYNNLECQCGMTKTPYDFIIIMGGTNDILQGRRAEDCFHMLKKNVAYIQSLGAIPILGLPPHIDFDPDGDNAVVKAYGELILAYAKAQGLVVINFYDALLAADARKEIIFAGDVHPNTLGYRYMYETAWPIIDEQVKAHISYKDRT
ncbi:SGNH/GDSL hydrolase family protein [uncultured Veillonella sp.]|uniref:SGNH/GDSL hydrolase family protein n=1 Tax=uncultured Veillonella sp. TaxID=159268 RepID=UPI002608FD91|nr:SGNH/GDSL hydrolase family protein [uncultured Veillonella sp.]